MKRTMNPKTRLYVIANNTKQKSNLSTRWSYVLVYELVAWWRWLVLSFIKQHVDLFLPFSSSVNYKEYKNRYMSIFLQEFHCYAIYSCVITRKCTFCLFVCLSFYQLARVLIVTSSSLPLFTNLIWGATNCRVPLWQMKICHWQKFYLKQLKVMPKRTI